MSIPGSTCIPGAELLYRMREITPNTNTLVVVNCAGRTRSIIGAQSLINAEISNKVVALRNGTMGWHLAGYELEHDQTRYVDEVGMLNGEEAQHHAASVAKRFGVRTIDHRTLSEVATFRHAQRLPARRSQPGRIHRRPRAGFGIRAGRAARTGH